MDEQLDIFTTPQPFDPNPPFLRGKFRLRHPIDPYKRWGAEEISTGIFRTCSWIWRYFQQNEEAK